MFNVINPEQQRDSVAALFLSIMQEAFEKDPEAIEKLVEFRVPCNKKIEDESRLIPYAEKDDDSLQLGMLGVINGILDSLASRRLIASYTDDNKLLGFTSFLKYPKEEKK